MSALLSVADQRKETCDNAVLGGGGGGLLGCPPKAQVHMGGKS
jgi:hypothetical protein